MKGLYDMNNYDKFRSMTIEEMAQWFEKNFDCDDTPWINSFNEKYCKNCELVKGKCKDYHCNEMIFTYCELFDKCRYFEDEEGCPSDKLMIKLWLNGEV